MVRPWHGNRRDDAGACAPGARASVRRRGERGFGRDPLVPRRGRLLYVEPHRNCGAREAAQHRDVSDHDRPAHRGGVGSPRRREGAREGGGAPSHEPSFADRRLHGTGGHRRGALREHGDDEDLRPGPVRRQGPHRLADPRHDRHGILRGNPEHRFSLREAQLHLSHGREAHPGGAGGLGYDAILLGRDRIPERRDRSERAGVPQREAERHPSRAAQGNARGRPSQIVAHRHRHRALPRDLAGFRRARLPGDAHDPDPGEQDGHRQGERGSGRGQGGGDGLGGVGSHAGPERAPSSRAEPRQGQLLSLQARPVRSRSRGKASRHLEDRGTGPCPQDPGEYAGAPRDRDQGARKERDPIARWEPDQGTRPEAGYRARRGFHDCRRLSAKSRDVKEAAGRFHRGRSAQEGPRCLEADLRKVTPPRNPLLAVLALALVTGAPAPALAEHTPGVPGWQQDVHYSISASYTPAKFEIAGRETLAYWNLSPDTLSELYFHLYLNAYRPGSHMARHDAYFENWKIENLPSRRRGSETIDGVTLLRGDPVPVQVA